VIILLYKNMSSLGVAICDPRGFIWTKLNILVLGVIDDKYYPI